MSGEKRNYLHIEQPDHGTGATIDFSSFRTTEGHKIEDVTVKVTLTYNSRTGKPELYVYATTGDHARIVLDEVRETDITDADDLEDEEVEADEEDDDGG